MRAERAQETADDWLGLSITRMLTALGPAAVIEILSPLYATLQPWDALEHKAIFDALDRLCGEPRCQGRFTLFALRRDDQP